MQVTITVPDNLPEERLQQRLKELEESLRQEAKFLESIIAKIDTSKEDNDPWKNSDIDLPFADAGIEDLSLNHDYYLYLKFRV